MHISEWKNGKIIFLQKVVAWGREIKKKLELKPKNAQRRVLEVNQSQICKKKSPNYTKKRKTTVWSLYIGKEK